MLEKFMLVSRDEFANELRALILQRANAVKGVVGLFAERELQMWGGVPNRLFKESKRKVRRAEGVGPQAVKPTKSYDPSVGSEGLVAQLITELCRQYPEKFANHPGPNLIRSLRVRAFYVVTDLVGSGRRAKTYLNAAWRVRSVRSWWSGHFLRFEVVAYAATQQGTKFIEKHSCRPKVSSVIPCPTIQSSCSNRAEAGSIAALCIAYDPSGKDGVASLGVGGLGVLMAFAHGAPNNAPRIFHKKSTRWTPLFPARVTSSIETQRFGRNLSAEGISQRLTAMRQRVLARSPTVKGSSDESKLAFLLLAALGRGPRGKEPLAQRTGLTIPEVERVCAKLEQAGWIDGRRRLTDEGHGQLAHARSLSAHMGLNSSVVNLENKKKPYYPSLLRMPR